MLLPQIDKSASRQPIYGTDKPFAALISIHGVVSTISLIVDFKLLLKNDSVIVETSAPESSKQGIDMPLTITLEVGHLLKKPF